MRLIFFVFLVLLSFIPHLENGLGKIVVGNRVVEHSHQHKKLTDRTFTVVLIFTKT
jgi:hypothetical protein